MSPINQPGRVSLVLLGVGIACAAFIMVKTDREDPPKYHVVWN